MIAEIDIRELFSCVRNMNLSSFRPSGELIREKGMLSERFMPGIETVKKLCSGEQEMPVMISNNTGFVWIADRNTRDAEQPIILLGPVFVDDYDPAAVERDLIKTMIPFEERVAVREQIRSLPVLPLTHFQEYGIMLHYCISGETISIADFRYHNTDAVSDRTLKELADAHASWITEQQLMRMIEEGNLSFASEAGRLVAGVNLSSLGSGDYIRHLKNVIIVSITLCSRAAIRGGLLPDIAYTMSDRYINAVEAANSLPELAEINLTMQNDYVTRVHELKTNGGSKAILRVKELISANPERSFTVDELAGLSGYSRAHFSRKFRESTGSSVTEYITRVKIERAKDLLRDGKMSIQDIAFSLGYGSASYFAERFRLETGMSPGKFRDSREKDCAGGA